jgi:hypothetical protein
MHEATGLALRRAACLVAPAIIAGVVVVAAEGQVVRYIDGLFVAPRGGAPIELIAYAEELSIGTLRMQYGTLEDAPLVHEVVSVLATIPNWRPRSVIIASAAVFRDHRAERRSIVFAVNKLNVYALGLRISDLEERSKVESLLRAVRASYDNPGYAFIGMESDGYVRYYPMRLTPHEK